VRDSVLGASFSELTSSIIMSEPEERTTDDVERERLKEVMRGVLDEIPGFREWARGPPKSTPAGGGEASGSQPPPEDSGAGGGKC
jgi:hypothetical protein